ncbi:hypothetical protein E2I00_020163 [Balaenoptera physalus]|uniref:Uncharacterized protein n=1 Tax=Balaenoptera physalus TaxID=9770 RepID=A0A643C8U8_BALPH|nr:hypothetical protein E2I00_020163 [Balaenoptera physalus]
MAEMKKSHSANDSEELFREDDGGGDPAPPRAPSSPPLQLESRQAVQLLQAHPFPVCMEGGHSTAVPRGLEEKTPANDVARFLHKRSAGGVTAHVFPAALDILEVRQKPILMT